jgi:hypothetical protein
MLYLLYLHTCCRAEEGGIAAACAAAPCAMTCPRTSPFDERPARQVKRQCVFVRLRAFACVCVACVRSCVRATWFFCPRLALARLCSWGPALSQLHFSLSTVVTLYIPIYTYAFACVRACVRFAVNVDVCGHFARFFCTHHALGVSQGRPELTVALS